MFDFSFFLSRDIPVKRSDILWRKPMPVNREVFQGKAEKGEKDEKVTIRYGDYFAAARDFLEQNAFERLKFAIDQQANHPVRVEEIKSVQIHLEKHGEFYHPSRINIVSEKAEMAFVLNVAISKAGRDLIPREVEVLNHLNRKYLPPYLPKAYGLGDVFTKTGFNIRMFLGDWFEGFHEFHVAFDRTRGEFGICVWDPDREPFFLTGEQTNQLYRQAALILTSYYDVETFEQILPWHHASGDFVLSLSNERIALRLVTARGYASVIRSCEGNGGAILESLLVFLLNMSIQMRLDRVHGTGDVIWSSSTAVDETLQGFFQALTLKAPVSTLPGPLTDCFFAYLCRWTQSELYDLSEAVVNRYNPLSPDVPVVRQHLKAHIDLLYNIVQRYPIAFEIL